MTLQAGDSVAMVLIACRSEALICRPAASCDALRQLQQQLSQRYSSQSRCVIIIIHSLIRLSLLYIIVLSLYMYITVTSLPMCSL